MLGENYANKRYFHTLQNGERQRELSALERNGIPTRPAFMRRRFANHSKPVQLAKCRMIKLEPIVLLWQS